MFWMSILSLSSGWQSILKMEESYSAEMLADIYQTTRCHMTEDGNLHDRLILYHELEITEEEVVMGYFILLASICLNKLKNTIKKFDQYELNTIHYHVSSLVQSINYAQKNDKKVPNRRSSD